MPLHYDGEVRVVKVNMGPYNNNGYLLICPHTGECVIIDAPDESEKLLNELGGGPIKAILITHGHHDHFLGLAKIKGSTGAPVGVHSKDASMLPQPHDFLLDDGDVMQVGTVELRVMHTPGHTPGAVCLLTGQHLFTGDTLFPGGPGSTSSPQALHQEIESITQKLMVLPDKVAVYPGHGADTTISKAKEEYQVFAANSHPPDLCGDVEWLKS